MRNLSEVRDMFGQAGLNVKMQQRLMLGHILITVGVKEIARP